jgi:hypothetical protein
MGEGDERLACWAGLSTDGAATVASGHCGYYATLATGMVGGKDLGQGTWI